MQFGLKIQAEIGIKKKKKNTLILLFCHAITKAMCLLEPS